MDFIGYFFKGLGANQNNWASWHMAFNATHKTQKPWILRFHNPAKAQNPILISKMVIVQNPQQMFIVIDPLFAVFLVSGIGEFVTF